VLADDEALEMTAPFVLTSLKTYRILNTMIGALTDLSKRATGANILLNDAFARWNDKMPCGIVNKRCNFGAFKRLFAVDPAVLARNPSIALGTDARAAQALALLADLLPSFVAAVAQTENMLRYMRLS
jgi:hypothetical protein